MNSKEKRIAYFDLKGGQHFDADLALLREKDPDNDWSKKKVFNPEKAAPEILFALLDHASKEEIVANRRKFSKVTTPDPLAEKSVELEASIEKLKTAGTTEELHLIIKLISEVIGNSGELDEKFGTIAVSAFNESVIRIDKANAEAKEAAEKELLTVDIATLDVEAMLSLLTRIGFSIIDQDPEALRSALQNAYLQLEKTADGSGEQNTGIPAVPGQVNELDSSKTLETLNSLSSENEELLEQNESLQLEIEDLEEQKEELLEQNETLQEKLEDEKKNLPQEQAPKQAEKSKKSRNSPKSPGQNSKGSKSSKRQ